MKRFSVNKTDFTSIFTLVKYKPRSIDPDRSGPWISDTNHSLMSIGISDLSSLSHHILQISPAENRKLNLEPTEEDEHVTQIVPFTPLVLASPYRPVTRPRISRDQTGIYER